MMNIACHSSRLAALALGLALALPAGAQNAPQADTLKSEYKPQVGQAGKDVVWVPTPPELVERMLDMAKVTAQDTVVDLGSGDGRIAIAAAKRGAKTKGIEYNPDMVELSRKNAAAQGMGDKVDFVRGDIFETDFGNATVITMYLLPGLNMKLRPKLLDMKPGTRIVSHAFTMEDWEPDQSAEVEYRNAYLWIVPAKVEGVWRVSNPAGSGQDTVEVQLSQKFQKVAGSARRAGRESPVTDGRLSGDRITFAFTDAMGVKREYSGKVTGDRIEGTTKLQTGATVPFTATRNGS
jgi:SAM-dependent methyltransferase